MVEAQAWVECKKRSHIHRWRYVEMVDTKSKCPALILGGVRLTTVREVTLCLVI